MKLIYQINIISTRTYILPLVSLHTLTTTRVMASFTPEVLAFIREVAENELDKLGRYLPTPTLKSEMPEVQLLMSKIKNILDERNEKGLKGQYRDKTKKKKFNLKSAFLLGATTNALGASKNKDGSSNFGTPHNIPEKKGKCVCLKPVLERVLPKWKKDLWTLSRQLIEIIDPDFAIGEYVVNYSTMTDPTHYVKKHTDSDDISYQYGMSLGDYEGTFKTRIYDADDDVVGDYNYKNRVLKMDGRLPHEVITEGFKGVRHCVIFFKSYDHRKSVCDPILETPCFV